MIESLRDQNVWVRYSAAVALGRMGDRKARRALRGCLKEDLGPVKIAAMEALRVLEEPEMIVLLAGLSEDRDEEVRIAVAENLLHYTGEDAAQVLHSLQNDPHPRVRQAARSVPDKTAGQTD